MGAYTMFRCEELGQEAGQQLDLVGTSDKLVFDHADEIHLVLHTLEQERALADLSQLYQLIGKTLSTTRLAVSLSAGADDVQHRH
jgi:hypothetical protein